MRRPQPFFRKDRSLWYVQLNGRQINLGRDEVEAWKEFHRLMMDVAQGQPSALEDSITARDVFNLFLTDLARTSAAATHDFYERYCQSFKVTLPKTMKPNEVKPFAVYQWLATHPTWGPASRRAAIRSVKRAFAWAADAGLIVASPLGKLQRPPNTRRETLLTREQVEYAVRACRFDASRDLLRLLADTGCRVQEARMIEARHIDADGRIVFPANEHKTGSKTGKPRVIYLPESVRLIVEQRAKSFPVGPIFRSVSGQPWTRNTIRLVFRALRRHKEHGKVLPPDLCGTLFRHAWITESLRRGLSPQDVAELAGHSSLDMITRIYSKLAKMTQHLIDAARRAVA